MSASRDAIFGRLRAARPWLPEEEAPPKAVVASGDGMLERFIAAAKAVDAELSVDTDLEAAKARLKSLLEGEKVIAWDQGLLPPGTRFGDTGRLDASLGLTACDMAIAETGSLVLVAGPGKSREASLLPRTHVALLDPRQLLPDLAAALEKLKTLGPLAHVNIITGPSRTADIEMTLTKGVHGPKRLLILVAPWHDTQGKMA